MSEEASVSLGSICKVVSLQFVWTATRSSSRDTMLARSSCSSSRAPRCEMRLLAHAARRCAMKCKSVDAAFVRRRAQGKCVACT
eukprot:scaffold117030_cov58-Phaeocystis_antarctica.AAC.5